MMKFLDKLILINQNRIISFTFSATIAIFLMSFAGVMLILHVLPTEMLIIWCFFILFLSYIYIKTKNIRTKFVIEFFIIIAEIIFVGYALIQFAYILYGRQ